MPTVTEMGKERLDTLEVFWTIIQTQRLAIHPGFNAEINLPLDQPKTSFYPTKKTD